MQAKPALSEANIAFIKAVAAHPELGRPCSFEVQRYLNRDILRLSRDITTKQKEVLKALSLNFNVELKFSS